MRVTLTLAILDHLVHLIKGLVLIILLIKQLPFMLILKPMFWEMIDKMMIF